MRAYLADVIRELPIGPGQHQVCMMQYSGEVQVKSIVYFKIVGLNKNWDYRFHTTGLAVLHDQSYMNEAS